jgi:acetyltransferase-like isoleucine patch superfamily enzyme
MNTTRLHFVRIIFRLLPETRAYAFKAALLRWCGAVVGRQVRVCSSVTIMGGGELVIGADTWIGHQTIIFSTSSVRIQARVDIGPQVYIGTGTHDLHPTGSRMAGPGRNLDVEIGEGAWLGARTMILPGVRVGDRAVTAAGAVVAHPVPDGVLVGGVPARILKTLVCDR